MVQLRVGNCSGLLIRQPRSSAPRSSIVAEFLCVAQLLLCIKTDS